MGSLLPKAMQTSLSWVLTHSQCIRGQPGRKAGAEPIVGSATNSGLIRRSNRWRGAIGVNREHCAAGPGPGFADSLVQHQQARPGQVIDEPEVFSDLDW